MKKIFFGSSDAPTGGNEPFWKPWGASWLLRLLGFLVLLFALLLLLNLFKSTKSSNDFDDEDLTEIPDPIIHPVTPDPVRVPVDTTANVPHDISNPSPNLPSPDENNIPPFDEDDITDDNGRQIVGDRLNIILNSSANDDTFNKWADEFKALYPGEEYKVVYYDKLTKLLQIQIPQEEREQIMHDLPNKITDIQFKVFPDGLMGNLEASRPNDLIFEDPDLSWYFKPIQAYEAWQITKGSPDIVVAICDSYFDLNHDDLNSNRIVKPYSVVRHTGNVAPAEGADELSFLHGSMVASQALGNMNNQRGTAGIAPQCKFMPVSLGHQMTSITILQGLLYAIYQGASVVNLSVGSSWTEEIMQLDLDDQIALSQMMALEEQSVWDWVAELAHEHNVTIVWAAGNENVFTALDACKRGNATIKVSAVDRDLKKAEFSNYGNFPERRIMESTISAPGVDILGAKPFNSYFVGPGTSFAAPIVTGAVALMKSIDPTLSTEEIINILQETGKPIGEPSTIGNLIQIKDALMKVKENFVRFDDLMHDHSKFIGLWESTTLLYRIDGEGNTTTDRVRILFDVTSESEGQVIYYEPALQLDFTAPITITWASNRIDIMQTAKATNSRDSRNYTAVPFKCRPDADGLLNCSHIHNGQNVDGYKLKKVRQRNYNGE